MFIVYYDKNDGSNWAPESLYRFREAISKVIDDKILFIPKNIDVVLDAPAEQLVALRNYIDSALKEKENK